MTAPGGLSLARVTVAAPERRMDVALPDTMLVGELLPHLLRHAGEDLADEGEQHGGWALHRATGTALEANRNLAAQGVHDGEVLHLVPRRVDWPEIAYDDVVEVIASGSRRASRSWGRPATRRAGLTVAAAILGLGLPTVLLAGPPWIAPAAIALSVAAVLAVLGILLSRAFADAGAGAVAAASGLPYAFVGGVLLAVPPDTPVTSLGAPGLLLGSAILLAASVMGFTGVAAIHRVFMAGQIVGFAGLLAALLGLAGLTPAGAAAIVLTVVIGLLPGYPLLASWLGRLPVPELPDRPEGILEDRPMPRRTDVFAAVARGTELLTGMVLAAAVVGAIAIAVLVLVDASIAGALLCFAGSAALLLRSRLFPTAPQRIPLMASGLVGLAALAYGAVFETTGIGTRLLILSVIIAVALLVLASGLVYSRRSPSPYIGRLADIADVVAIMALIPLAGVVCGLFAAIQDLFASIGG